MAAGGGRVVAFQSVATRKSKPWKGGPRSQGRLQRALDEAAAEAARREISAALAQTDGNVTKAATILGVSRVNLTGRMRALKIPRKS